MNKYELNKAGIEFAEKMFESHGFSVDRPTITRGPVDFTASLNGRTMKIKIRTASFLGCYIFMEKRRFNICDKDLFMAVAYQATKMKKSYMLPAQNGERMYIL